MAAKGKKSPTEDAGLAATFAAMVQGTWFLDCPACNEKHWLTAVQKLPNEQVVLLCGGCKQQSTWVLPTNTREDATDES